MLPESWFTLVSRSMTLPCKEFHSAEVIRSPGSTSVSGSAILHSPFQALLVLRGNCCSPIARHQTWEGPQTASDHSQRSGRFRLLASRESPVHSRAPSTTKTFRRLPGRPAGTTTSPAIVFRLGRLPDRQAGDR